jgi:hypothetical protein
MPQHSDSQKTRLIRLEQLNLELLDTLELCLFCTKDFCEKHKIPFYDEKILASIEKIEMLIDEISPPSFLHTPKLADDFLQRKRTDEDLTEPFQKRFAIDPL